MTYNWELNFSILLTLILATISLLTQIISKINKIKNKKIDLYEPIYFDVITLIKLPIKVRESYVYNNKNKLIQKIVRRKINDFRNEVDTYWTYYNKPEYPELNEIPESKKRSYINHANKEFNKYLFRINSDYCPSSPAFYYEKYDKCKESLDKIINHFFKNKSKLPKKLDDIFERIISNPPKKVYQKYKTQIRHDSDYFKYNQVMFDDPYEELIFYIKSEYERLTTLFYIRVWNKCYEFFMRLKYLHNSNNK